MRLLITVFILSIGLHVNAQSWFKESVKGNGELVNITRNTAEYDELSVAGSFEVTLVKGEEGKLEVSVEENLKKHLVTKVKDGKLIIRWDNNFKVKPKKTVRIKVPFEDIEAVSLAGSGNIESDDVIKSNDFAINTAGSGDIALKLSATDVSCNMAGSGNVSLVGSSSKFDCSKAGSGNLYSYKFACENVKIEGVGSGNAEVYVSVFLNAKIAGSGNIYYKGSPKNNDIKVAGSGSIIMK